MNPAPVSPGLARLRGEFLESLEQRVAELERLSRALDGSVEDGERLTTLYREAQTLAQAAQVFDVGLIRGVAESLRAALAGVRRAPAGPDRDLIHAGVRRLVTSVEAFRHRARPIAQARMQPLGGRPAESRVRLIDDGGDAGREVARMLDEQGLRVTRGETDASGSDAAPDDAPFSAVVLCAETVAADGDGLPGLWSALGSGLPVLAVARSWSPGARLECVRRGVARCLDHPLATDTLIEQLMQIGGVIVESDYRVLLVTNDATGDGLGPYLTGSGLGVASASDPEGVRRHLDETGADVVVLDLQGLAEPVESFVALLRTRDNGGAVPLLLLTEDPGRVNHLMTLHPGVSGVFLTPVEPACIAAAITARARQLRQIDGVSQSYRDALYEREREHVAVNEHALVSIADVAGNIIYANERFSRVSGYAVAELLGRNHRILRSGQHPPEFYAELWATIAAGRIWQGEVCNRARNGSLYWVETTIVPYLGSNGRPYQYVSIRTEITHVKHQEHRLRSSQIFANMGTWEWAPDRETLGWSERIPPLLGYPEGGLEPTVSNFLNAVHPDDRARVRAAVASSLRRGSYLELEHRVIWPDGSEHWLLERGDVVRGQHGEILYMLGVMQDITKRKSSELALSQLSTRLLESQRLARIGNWEMDPHSGQITWSRVIHEIFEMDAGDAPLERADYLNLVHSEDRNQVETFMGGLGESGHHEIGHRVQLPGGRIRHVHMIASGSFDADGQLTHVGGSLQDITELHEAQEHLALFQRIFESSEQGIEVVDREGRFVYVNAAALEMLGYRSEELLGRDFHELGIIPAENKKEEQEIDRVLAEGGAWTGKLPQRCASGAVFITASTIGVVRDARGEPQYGFNIFSDFTDELRRRSELHRAREAAEAANRAKSDFLSNMSHELRTPMNAVLGFAQLLESDPALEEQQRGYLDEITRAGRHLLDLINEILDLARIEAGRMQVEPEPVAPDPVLEDCLSLLAPMAREYRVELEPDHLPEVMLQADPRRLKQVLLNLLSNAIKYNRPGGSVRVRCELGETEVRIAVHDSGPGLNAEQCRRLFQPFERLAADQQGIEGSGVGLAITRNLVDLMGGEIGVDSVPGEGSTFWFRLPRARDRLPPGTGDDAALPGSAGAPRDCRVLCIEDHDANQRLMREMLKQQGAADCRMAESAAEGLDMALRDPPELILLDLNLPVMDGFQVLRALRAEPELAAIPVIAVTADATDATCERVEQAGFHDLFTKPIGASDLLRALEHCRASRPDG
ncbi:PAS domain-containing protein [Thioalkalivibrio sp. ALMg11]|uniref:PAS domain-containing protein n=1 Tax=Thioalkalivibrio sp. ALMg11 TaxID=1158165 RepID=UPI00036DCAC6|nr:PAS domain-containing protein [Thioalkalivibrio sp. ALMg11]